MDRIHTTVLSLPAQECNRRFVEESLLGRCSLSKLYDVVGFDFDMFWLDRNFKSEHLQPVSQESSCSEDFGHGEECRCNLSRTVSIAQECQVRDAVKLGRADKVNLRSHDGHVIESGFVAR